MVELKKDQLEDYNLYLKAEKKKKDRAEFGRKITRFFFPSVHEMWILRHKVDISESMEKNLRNSLRIKDDNLKDLKEKLMSSEARRMILVDKVHELNVKINLLENNEENV